MKKYGTQRSKSLVAMMSALVVIAGLGLLGYWLFGGEAAPTNPEIGTVETGLVGAPEKPAVPKDTSMTLTVPKMERVDGVPVYTAPASDTGTLDRGTMHVEGTGFPWDPEANVYIAGHRLGYKDTGSYLQFYDLPKLKKGDEILLTGADGKTYTYEVFRKFRVDPSQFEVTQPIAGKNIVSLQTCTLPNYTQRLIVQGELKSVS